MTREQEGTLGKIKKDGGAIWTMATDNERCAGEWSTPNGAPLPGRTVRRLISLGILVANDDGLFDGAKSQTYRVADKKPLAIDLFCGLGGWTDGLLAEGWDVIGFDIERHEYLAPEESASTSNGHKGTRPVKKRGWTQGCAVSLGLEGDNRKPAVRRLKYPAQMVVQDVLTLHGSQFKSADLIVASPPCQEYSYMAMPWSRAKQIARALRGEGVFPENYKGSRTIDDLNRLFNACFRIQREASEAAGKHIPMVVENVRGAIPWVGRSRWNYGSFHLWGDVPALMPDHKAIKNNGGSWFAIGSPGQKVTGQNPDGRKCGGDWFNSEQPSEQRKHASGSNARKMASAMIAKIPEPLSRHIARTFKPCQS